MLWPRKGANIENLSAQAEQALEKVSRPDVDFVEGLSPVLSIGRHMQFDRSKYGCKCHKLRIVRLLWATVGVPHCHWMDQGLQRSLDDCVMEVINEGLVLRMISLPNTAKASVLREEFESLEHRGYQRVRIEMRKGLIMIYCRRVQVVNSKLNWLLIAFKRIKS